ncbi:MAG: electron transport complex subunit RsxC [Gammaproteobacteria bacterium]|nr:electron transport complex subunit RsxC [Gammaproteobacteria bacterium]MDH4310816.1 electron transport complex subunit RsxC [Gammaproteobacteria bacterium]MDH5272113.1 electron transport complex subunit RsxC [Gammaproteobacteria bacterium]
MAARSRFPAGLALDTHKQQACGTPIVELALPAQVVLALDQGTGYGAEPVVAVGAAVAMGTLVARTDHPFASALHAPLAGTVVAIETRAAAVAGGRSVCIVIAGDGSDRVDDGVTPVPDADALSPDELAQRLRAAGIAGLGGAGFPTATKLASARDRRAQTLLLNGAECEPWICCDDALMRSAADDVVLGALILRRAAGAVRCVIAIEDDKPAAIAAVTGAIGRRRDDALTLEVIPAVYPQGAERQLVTTVTGVEVPSGGLPADAGVICQNVATAAAVARWATSGEPLLSRVVTVTGSGVERPCNVRAPIGTPLAALIAASGGYRGTPLRLIAGGSMTGRALPSDEVGLTKAMNCVFVATRDDIGARLGAVELPCIRCGDCASVCPAGLLPQQLHRAALADAHDALRDLGVRDCIDCGLCDYVCPSQIPLADRFRDAKRRLDEAAATAQKAADARQRHELHMRRLQEAATAEHRAFEDVRRRVRQPGDDPTDGAD